METVTHKRSIMRTTALSTLICLLVVVCLAILSKYQDIIFLLGFFALISILIGMILGYSSALREIKDKIFSLFNKDVKISVNGQTLISGSLIILIKDLKLEGILIENNFVEEKEGVEQIEEEILESKKTFKVLIGDEFILKGGR